MNNDRERLLGDILAEPGGSGELRDALLARTLREVKRRRTVRRVQLAGWLLVLPALALLLWRAPVGDDVRSPSDLSSNGLLTSSPETSRLQLPYVLVRTEPLSGYELLGTQPLAASGLVASTPSLNMSTVITRPEEREYREIDDVTLLALAGNAAVLVRLGPHAAELVLASGTMAGQFPE